MFDPQMELVSTVLRETATKLEANGDDASAWGPAREAAGTLGDEDAELAALVQAQDAGGLLAVIAEWESGDRHLPLPDREVLKRAMKAFRKSFKVTLLDAESSLGGGPMSSGRHSSIVGIVPPPRYGRPVWDELVRQGRLGGGKEGIYELPPGG